MTQASKAPTMSAYIITNTVSGKRYVGITTKGVEQRWKSHVRLRNCKNSCRILARAIIAYGPDAFLVEHIACARTLDELKALEVLLIEQHGTLAPHGYNLTSGGDGGFEPAPEVREAFRKNAHVHCFRSAEERAALGDNVTWRTGGENRFFGRRHTPESLALMSASHKGHRHSEETKARMSAAHKSAVFSAERRANISAGKTGKKVSPAALANLTASNRRIADQKRGLPGKPASAATKQKLSDYMLKKWASVKAAEAAALAPAQQSLDI